MIQICLRHEREIPEHEYHDIRQMSDDRQERILARWIARGDWDYASSDWSADSFYSRDADEELELELGQARLNHVARYATLMLQQNGHPIEIFVENGFPVPRSIFRNPDAEVLGDAVRRYE